MNVSIMYMSTSTNEYQAFKIKHTIATIETENYNITLVIINDKFMTKVILLTTGANKCIYEYYHRLD